MMDYKLMNNEENNNYIMKYKEALLTIHVIYKFVTPQETGPSQNIFHECHTDENSDHKLSSPRRESH